MKLFDKFLSVNKTAWSHLPNAKHINWVFASLEEHPKKWATAAKKARPIPRDVVQVEWPTAQHEAWDAAKKEALDIVARHGSRLDEYYASIDAILALIADDDCAYLIETDVDELRILAALGDTRAVLLLPACIVFNEIRKLR